MQDEKHISLKDLQKLYVSYRKTLLKFSLISGFVVSAMSFLQPITYQAKGIFKNAKDDDQSGSPGAWELFSSKSEANESVEIMKSKSFSQKLAKSLGLQIVVESSSSSRIRKGFERFATNLLLSLGKGEKPREAFVFEEVVYTKPFISSYYLKIEKDSYLIYDLNKTCLAKSQIGEEIRVSDFSATLLKIPKECVLDTYYRIKLLPLEAIANFVRDQIVVVPGKNFSNYIEITCAHRNPNLATRIVNKVMNVYQKHLLDEHEYTTNMQIEAMNRHRQSLCKEYDEALKNHVAYIEQTFGSYGTVGFKQAADSLTDMYQRYFVKREALELEAKWLNSFLKHPTSPAVGGEFSAKIAPIIKEVDNLRSQKELLDLSLSFQLDFQKANRIVFHNDCNDLESEEKKLQRVRKEISLLKRFQKNPELLKNALFPSQESSLALPISLSSTDFLAEEKALSVSWIQENLRLLSLKEKTLEERLLQSIDLPKSLGSVDLVAAMNLFHSCNAQLDEQLSSLQHLRLALKGLEDPSFDATSLSFILGDPNSVFHIDKISENLFKNRDEKNISSKEKERNLKEIALHKNFLKDHVKELIAVKKMDVARYEAKAITLQQICRDRINSKICVLQNKMKDFYEERKGCIAAEIQLLDKRLQELRNEMKKMPDKWRQETLLDLQRSTSLRIIDTMAQIFESKSLQKQLYRIQSHPVDYAYIVQPPAPPKFVLLFFLAAICIFVFLYLYYFFKTLLAGFPVSEDLILSYNKRCFGELSLNTDGGKLEFVYDNDLETLRKIAYFLTTKGLSLTAGLITGKGANYTFALAEILAKRGIKVLVIQCLFNSKYTEKDLPGLLGYFNKGLKCNPIIKGEYFDLLPSGGTSRYGAELLASKKFQALLDYAKENYEITLVHSKSPAGSVEATILTNVCDSSVISLKEETEKEISTLLNDSGNNSNLSFLLSV